MGHGRDGLVWYGQSNLEPSKENHILFVRDESKSPRFPPRQRLDMLPRRKIQYPDRALPRLAAYLPDNRFTGRCFAIPRR